MEEKLYQAEENSIFYKEALEVKDYEIARLRMKCAELRQIIFRTLKKRKKSKRMVKVSSKINRSPQKYEFMEEGSSDVFFKVKKLTKLFVSGIESDFSFSTSNEYTIKKLIMACIGHLGGDVTLNCVEVSENKAYDVYNGMKEIDSKRDAVCIRAEDVERYIEIVEFSKKARTVFSIGTTYGKIQVIGFPSKELKRIIRKTLNKENHAKTCLLYTSDAADE